MTHLASVNYFDNGETARRYASARPEYHALAAARIATLSGCSCFENLLDCGCGTGSSSRALAEIAREVTGLDPSAGMLAQTAPHARVTYRQGSAEALPFPDACFDLVTVAAALHWFDAQGFYSECRRVLRTGGWLAVYNDHFTTHLRGVAEFSRWMRRIYLKRYKAPWRGMRDFDEETAKAAGFCVRAHEGFEHAEFYTRRGFTDYLMTHSNALSAIESEQESAEQVAAWIDGELQAFLPGEAEAEFLFKCNLWLLQIAVTHSSKKA